MIIDAFHDVERHKFVPDTDLQAAYIDDAVAIKHDTSGEIISCISTPSIVATQLEQLGVRPGHKILEAGAATGYNVRNVRCCCRPRRMSRGRCPTASRSARPR